MIHPKALDKMKKSLKLTLENCKVENTWPVFNSYYDNLKKFASEVIKHRKDWIDFSSVLSIFSNRVWQALSEKFPNNRTATGGLKELLGNEITEQLFDSVIKYIESIPRKYQFCFPCPSIEGFGEGIVDLSKDFLIKNNHDTAPRGSLLVNALRGSNSGFLEARKTYICIEEDGYTEGSADDPAFINAFSKFKQFIHLGIINKLFIEALRAPIILGSSFSKGLRTVVFDKAEPDSASCHVSIPEHTAKYLEKISFSADFIAEMKTKEGVEYNQHKLEPTINLITAPADNEDANAIKSAVEWAFEASINSDETVAFLQICIGIEAILGDIDNEKEPLTTRLADRCAYILGKNMVDRKEIRDMFEKLYKVRSKLVHGRRVRLKKDDERYLFWGRRILDRLIRKEMNFLKID
ncbi:MAG: hypothetical protein HZB82_08235 [Deltaproteobacteria bacterium]|nr:hypothetical protein [Deltaproteobacteria bacterium]